MRPKHRRLPNYIRAYRKRIGLSQRELGQALGYAEEGSVGRHETFQAVPPLATAIGYAIIFQAPVSEIFAGLWDEVAEHVQGRLAKLETSLGQKNARDRNANTIARKLTWLTERRGTE